MKKKNLWLTYAIFSVLTLCINFQLSAQVGIGTTTPDASAILDLTSDSQGLLAPRMSTADRTAISSPAVGLLVFDTDEGAFFHSDGTNWVKIESNDEIRDNYKIVKSAADLADELTAGGGTKYDLDENTLYEINGTILLAVPIESNNAYIRGNDVGEDILLRSGGPVFQGSTGVSIRSLTVLANGGGSIFDLSLTATQRVVIQGSVFASSDGTGTAGSITGGALTFMSIVQWAGFSNGITFDSNGTLLLNNLGWLSTNRGTMQTFNGTFDLITQIGGFIEVGTSETGIDVSSEPTVTTGNLQTITFTGDGDYINGYTNGTYTDFDFTNNWTVNCTGIPRESDENATGDINLLSTVGSGFITSFTGTGTSSRIKIVGTTTSNNLFRFTNNGIDNRLIYEGSEARFFNVSASLSFQTTSNNTIYIWYIAKGNSGDANATVIEENRVFRSSGSNSDVGAVSLIGTIRLEPGDFIELWAERFSGAGNILTISLNLSVN